MGSRSMGGHWPSMRRGSGSRVVGVVDLVGVGAAGVVVAEVEGVDAVGVVVVVGGVVAIGIEGIGPIGKEKRGPRSARVS